MTAVTLEVAILTGCASVLIWSFLKTVFTHPGVREQKRNVVHLCVLFPCLCVCTTTATTTTTSRVWHATFGCRGCAGCGSQTTPPSYLDKYEEVLRQQEAEMQAVARGDTTDIPGPPQFKCVVCGTLGVLCGRPLFYVVGERLGRSALFLFLNSHAPLWPFFSMCRKCNAPKPPRSHHCSICGVCILKMDHHCPSVRPSHTVSSATHACDVVCVSRATVMPFADG